MVCSCCRKNGDNRDDVGSCIQCNRNACDYFANGHGEECLHCEKFYCYLHQNNHSTEVGRDPLTIFPRTFRKAFEILENLSKDPATYDRPKIALNHGLFLAKKLKNIEMENSFLNMLSMIEKNDDGNITTLRDMQSDMQTEMRNKISHDIPNMLNLVKDKYEKWPDWHT
jgi:hypothetical protein